MVNYFIYAKDYSGSTRGSSFYHKKGMQSVDQFRNDVKRIQKESADAEKATEESKIIYLHWGDVCIEVDENTTESAYKSQEGGYPGTNPESIIDFIKSNYDIGDDNKIKLLYIITDGLIGSGSIRTCFILNENMHYETVVFHAFNDNLSYINLSVAASFLKSRCVVYRNYELIDDTDISTEFDYDKINVENFVNERDNLKSYIKLKFINKFKHDVLALKEIDKLKKLRDRLFVELASETKKTVVNLNTKDRNEFLREFVNTDWYKNLNAPVQGIKVEIEKSISTLINYIVSDSKSYSFDALKFDTKFDNPIEEQPIVDVDFTAEQEIEFPDIIMDDEKGVPVILLTKLNLLDKIIFHTTKGSDEVSAASFNKFKTAMTCPLFLLNDPDVSQSIGYFYTLNVYKQLLDNNTKTEPRTRRPFHGGLVVIDTDEFDKYNDYILSATYFDSKNIKFNKGLFYFVLLKNCENKEWMDKNVVEQFRKYVMRRISATVCKIGLSSLPLDPQEETTLPTALWYCLELSSSLFKDDPKNYMHERMRMFYGVANSMIRILKYFNYDLDLKAIEKRIDLIRHVMILKKIPTKGDKLYYVVEKIFKSINGFLVSEIEQPQNLNYLNYLKFNHKDMLCDRVLEEKVHLNDHVNLLHVCNATVEGKIKISNKTFRPFFIVDQNKTFYTALVEDSKKVIINHDDDKDKINITYDKMDSLEFHKLLSLYNLFITYVIDSEKYPTLSEYTEFVNRKKKYYGNLVTIFPPNAYVGIKDAYSSYQKIMANTDVTKFIEISKKYVKRLERVKAEEIMEFKDEKEINNLISSEELKVNMKKK